MNFCSFIADLNGSQMIFFLSNSCNTKEEGTEGLVDVF